MQDASNEPTRQKLFLIDAMALAYRAHFALIRRPLVNSKGQDTSAIYGFVNSLLKLLEENPDRIAVVFDPPDGKSFRDVLYEDYKANRPPMPDPLREGIPVIKEVVRGFNIPVLEMEGMEADDVIGTLTRRAEEEGVDVVIVSPDKDFRQLLSARVTIMRPAYRGEEFERMTVDTFREQYGVEPIQFVDILALLGDSSDNVPGVPGIGQKTAPKLIADYGSVEQLLDSADQIDAKRIREGLLNNRDKAILSKQLVTIVTDLHLDVDWQTLRRTEPDFETLEALFDMLEFRTLMGRVVGKTGGRPDKAPQQAELGFGSGAAPGISAVEDTDYRQVESLDGVRRMAAALVAEKHFSLYMMMSGGGPMRASLIGIACSTSPSTASFMPVPLKDGCGEDEILEALRPALESTDAIKRGHMLKNAAVALRRRGIRLANPIFDTMVAHYLLFPEKPHGLDTQCRETLGLTRKPLSDLIGSGKSQKDISEVEGDALCEFACETVDVIGRLSVSLHAELEKDRRGKIAREIEFPLVHVLAEMERAGIGLDQSVLDEISGDLSGQVEELEQRIFQEAGETFNIGSPQQLGEILFDKLGLNPLRKTSTGRQSTNERVLSQLATEHPLPALVLDWRRLTKLKSTYVDVLGDYVHPETDRIHSSFNQTVAATGRLSSANPNLQNIPIRSGSGREIRRAFVPAEEMVFLAADYVQIELRILASMSGDPGLTAAFAERDDVHRATAARIFGVEPSEVDRDMRRKAKEVNFGIPYGISAYELSQRLRISRDEAVSLIDGYHKSYPEVAAFIRTTIESARENGYVETLLGRRRYVPAIRSKNFRDRSAAERIAVNMPIQGSQADMIKIAMVRIHERIDHLRSRLVLQVHDELVFETTQSEVEELTDIVREEMVGALPLNVPVEVEIGVGSNWLDAH